MNFKKLAEISKSTADRQRFERAESARQALNLSDDQCELLNVLVWAIFDDICTTISNDRASRDVVVSAVLGILRSDLERIEEIIIVDEDAKLLIDTLKTSADDISALIAASFALDEYVCRDDDM